MKPEENLKPMSQSNPTASTIALIGICITGLSFGINSAGNYAKLEARLAVIEYQLGQIAEKARANQQTLQRIDRDSR
jgi:hypothetical protein